MEVVRIVSRCVVALKGVTRQILMIHHRGGRIALRRLPITPQPHVDMRRHMHQMSGTRHQRGQPLRTVERALRVGRGFDRMNVIVTGTRMIRMLPQCRFQDRHDLLRPRLRPPIRAPVVPWPEHHHGFSRQGCGIGIIGSLPRNLTHRFGIGFVLHLAGDRFFSQVASGKGFHVGSLPGGGLRQTRSGLLNRLHGTGLYLGIHGRVDVRPQAQRHTPIGHGRIGIETGGLGEGRNRLLVIEGIDQPDPLIEKFLSEVGRW